MSHCQELGDRTSNPDTNWELLSFVKKEESVLGLSKGPRKEMAF